MPKTGFLLAATNLPQSSDFGSLDAERLKANFGLLENIAKVALIVCSTASPRCRRLILMNLFFKIVSS